MFALLRRAFKTIADDDMKLWYYWVMQVLERDRFKERCRFSANHLCIIIVRNNIISCCKDRVDYMSFQCFFNYLLSWHNILISSLRIFCKYIIWLKLEYKSIFTRSNHISQLVNMTTKTVCKRIKKIFLRKRNDALMSENMNLKLIPQFAICELDILNLVNEE